MKNSIYNCKGMSLIEILIAVAIFAVLGVMTTRSVALTLVGSRKSEATLRVKENVSYARGVIERQLRNANKIETCPSTGAGINYTDASGNPGSFSCIGIGTADSYIASGSARLTSSEVKITQCSFVCRQDANPNNPPSVDVTIVAGDSQLQGAEGATVTSSTKIYLRTY